MSSKAGEVFKVLHGFPEEILYTCSLDGSIIW